MSFKTRADLVGQVFGRLTVLSLDHVNPKGHTMWRCRCECGQETVVFGYNIKNGGSSSCGCPTPKPNLNLPPVSDIEASYSAGFFDGEGSAMIHTSLGPSGNRSYSGRVSISQADLRPLYWLQERFEGNIHQRTETSRERRPVFGWDIAGFKMDRFIEVIRPYVIVKAEPLDVLIAFRTYVLSTKNFKSHKITPDQQCVRAEFHRKLRVINQHRESA